MASAERTQSPGEQGASCTVASEGDRGLVRGDRLGCSMSPGPGPGGAIPEVCGRRGCRSRYCVGRSRCSNYASIMPHGRDRAQLTRVKDGRSWQIGDSSVVAWIAASTVTGLTITPPVFDDYATIVIPDGGRGSAQHDQLVIALLSSIRPINRGGWRISTPAATM